MAKAKFESLSVPPDALEKGGHEVLRASIVDGGVSVALQALLRRPLHLGRPPRRSRPPRGAHLRPETDLSEDEALEQIRAGLQAELDRPTDRGSTRAVN